MRSLMTVIALSAITTAAMAINTVRTVFACCLMRKGKPSSSRASALEAS